MNYQSNVQHSQIMQMIIIRVQIFDFFFFKKKIKTCAKKMPLIHFEGGKLRIKAARVKGMKVVNIKETLDGNMVIIK